MVISNSQVNMSSQEKNVMKSTSNRKTIVYRPNGTVEKTMQYRTSVNEWTSQQGISQYDTKGNQSVTKNAAFNVSVNEVQSTEVTYQEIKAGGLGLRTPFSGKSYLFVLFNSMHKRAGGRFKDTYMSLDELKSNKNLQLADLQKLQKRLQTATPPSQGNSFVFLSESEVYVESYEEVTMTYEQAFSFESQGIVRTADGREINFDITMNMYTGRSVTNASALAYKQVTFQDPLIINFDGELPTLTDEKISFDIDCDGTEEQVSFLGEGSGFLALDNNNDGKVNNGSELFGPQSGNGFLDLALHDSDGNGWIDEKDPVFQDLKVWTKDSSGNDKLLAISQAGIGAIYLGNVSTDMAIESVNGMVNGMLRNTGIYLNEDGTAGTVQHMDLAV